MSVAKKSPSSSLMRVMVLVRGWLPSVVARMTWECLPSVGFSAGGMGITFDHARGSNIWVSRSDHGKASCEVDRP
ncbi:MAG: hypothetical protein Q8O47_01095 [Candidatus Bathyarchaeota archaeon]|nr:hypothetical protein [Candidatus Bathyarchaeota archaeon]